MNHVPTKQGYNEEQPYYGQQGSGMPTQVVHAEVMPAYAVPMQAVPPGQTMNIAVCKGCGRQFIRQPGVNPATAQFHRCDTCNRRQGNEMLCLNITCGASSLCTIQ